MNRTLCLFLFLAATQLASVASEEEFVPWQSASIKSPELPVVGVVTIEASTRGDAYQKLTIGAFGRTHALAAAELKRLNGFPLSSLTLTHEAGYPSLGGHTLCLKLNRTYYDEAKTLTQKTILISVLKDASVAISEPEPR